jgi:large repetitive protein
MHKNGHGAKTVRRLSLGLAIGMAASLLPVGLPQALAARNASASVDRKISYRGNTYTYTFTITNTSTAGEPIASAALAIPVDVLSVTGCGSSTAWSAIAYSGAYCVFNSASGSGDDIPVGGSATFRLTASVDAGTQSVVGESWGVYVDGTDNLNYSDADGLIVVSPATTGALDFSLYAIEINDVVVSTASPTIGTTCPATNRKAPADSSRSLIVCGTNHGNGTFGAVRTDSSLSGTFLATAGTFAGGNVPAGARNVVLATYTSSSVTTSVNDALTVRPMLANGYVGSPRPNLTGYTTDTTAPAAPSVPDLAASSDTGVSSSDDLTKDATPTFTGTAEPNATVSLVVDGSLVATATAGTSGAYSVTPGTNLSDGGRSVAARATDRSGNAGPLSAAKTINVDTTPSSAPSIDGTPGQTGTGTSPAWTFSGAAGETFVCTLEAPGGTRTGDADCASPKTFSLTNGADGDYAFTVKQIDDAGNESQVSTHVYALDRQAPGAPSIDIRPPARTSDGSPEWSFTGESRASFRCVLVMPEGPNRTDDDCSSPKSIDLSSSPDGDYEFRLFQKDAAGNESSSSTDTFTLDRTGPNAPNITAFPASQSNDDTPRWEFSGENGGSFECALEGPDGEVSGSAPCNGTQDHDLTDMPDGTYTFKVRQSDDLGNSGQYASSSYTLDREDPAAPSIGSAPSGTTSDQTPEFAFSGEPGARFECVLVRFPRSEVGDANCGSPKSYDLSGADGDYKFKVRQIDRSGNGGEFVIFEFTLDASAPAAPQMTQVPASPSQDETPEWQFQGEEREDGVQGERGEEGEDGAGFRCELHMPNGKVDRAPCSHRHSYDLSAEPDGEYTFAVVQIDKAGNEGAPVTSTYILDRADPEAPNITTGPADQDDDMSPEWTFNGEARATYECKLVKPDGTGSSAPCSSPRSYSLATSEGGLYTFSVRQTDAAGNVGSWATDGYTFEPPVGTPLISGGAPDVTKASTHSWTLTGDSDDKYFCRLTHPGGSTDQGSCTSPYAVDLSDDEDGAYLLEVWTTEGAEEVAVDSFFVDRNASAIPALTSSPAKRTRDLNPTWAFTGEAGGTYRCELTSASGVLLSESCDGTHAHVLDPVQGKYTFSVVQIDAAGNESAPTVKSFYLDTMKPKATKLVVAKKASLRKVNVVKISFSRSEVASATIKILKGRKKVAVFSKKMGKTRVAYKWKLSRKMKTGTYTVVIGLQDKVGFGSKNKRAIQVVR